MADQTETAVKQNTADVADQSIQRRAESTLDGKGGAVSSLLWFSRHEDGSEIAPWWSERRDYDLRRFWLRPGNDILQGAVSSMVKKFKSMDWSLNGPQRVVSRYQRVLSEAEFGKGWAHLLGKVLADYLTQDKGAFIELIGAGDVDGPLQGPVMGIAHLDAAKCQLTGDPVWPVLFRNAKEDGDQIRKIHATRVIHLVDMPSPDEDMHEVGFCAVSRVIASSSVLLKLARYKNEKLDDLPESGLLLLSNVLEQQFNDAEANYAMDRRRLGQEVWAPVMRLFSLDPEKPISAQLVSFANLPDAFNEKEATELYINVCALAFGVDTREFWPMATGLGTASESLVMHQKAKGKGVGDIITSIERAINWKILPPTVEFMFDFQDDEEDRQRAEINDLKAKTIMSLWQFRQESGAEVEGPVTRDEIRQMLADNVDYFKPEFLETDLTDDVEQFDTDRDTEAGAADKQFYFDFGPIVTINRDGRLRRVPQLLPRMRAAVHRPVLPILSAEGFTE